MTDKNVKSYLWLVRVRMAETRPFRRLPNKTDNVQRKTVNLSLEFLFEF